MTQTQTQLLQLMTLYDRFPFALAITNATDVGNLTGADDGCTMSSSTYGYHYGMWTDTINRFPFASSITNAANIGTAPYRDGCSSHNSAEYGYITGGLQWGPPYLALTSISRWPFASGSVTIADVGNLSPTLSGRLRLWYRTLFHKLWIYWYRWCANLSGWLVAV